MNKLNTTILVLILICSVFAIVNTEKVATAEVVNEISAPEIIREITFDKTYVSIDSEYIGFNKSNHLLDIRVNMSSNKSIECNIHENYYKVNNRNETTYYNSNQLFNGTINNLTIVIQRPVDNCARNYTHIEQIITSGNYTRTITTDLRYLWYTRVEHNDAGYDMFYCRVDTRRNLQA